MTTGNADSDLRIDGFCRAHWRRLLNKAMRSVGSWSEAEDVVQELFLVLVRNGCMPALVSLSPEGQVSCLSLRLNSLIRNRWRNARRLRRVVMAEAIPLDESLSDLAASMATPASEADRAWLGHCIGQAMERLHQQTRERVWQEISPRLVGEGCDKPQTGAQRAALHRARQKLRELVREEMNGCFQEWHLPAQAFSKASATRSSVTSSRGRPMI